MVQVKKNSRPHDCANELHADKLIGVTFNLKLRLFLAINRKPKYICIILKTNSATQFQKLFITIHILFNNEHYYINNASEKLKNIRF